MKRQWIMFIQVFSIALHRKCISKMYYRCACIVLLFFAPSHSLPAHFLVGWLCLGIFVLINDSSCDSVLFSECMHFIRPAAYLPSVFLRMPFFLLLSVFPLWLHIYLFIFLLILCNSRAMPILFFVCSHFIFYRSTSNWVIFSLFTRKNIRCDMRAHYPLRRIISFFTRPKMSSLLILSCSYIFFFLRGIIWLVKTTRILLRS